MKIDLFGHAAVGLTTQKLRVLIDPYEPGGFGGHMGYPPIDFEPDLILITHAHLDHAHVAPFPGVPVLGPEDFRGPPRHPIAQAVEVDHDAFHGRTRGGQSWMLRLTLENMSIVHSGDIGELPEQHRLDAFTQGAGVDLLFVVCGGYYTLGGLEAAELAQRLGARVTIPMHYQTALCTLPHLGGPETLLAKLGPARRVQGQHVECTLAEIENTAERVWLMGG